VNAYAAALEDSVLPTLGDLYYDALTDSDVPAWIDRSLDGRWPATKPAKGRTAAGEVQSERSWPVQHLLSV
jgi:hypothetical protein